MSNSNLIFDYVIQFLRKCRHHKHERLDMKKVHGYLVRRGILFRCHCLHTGMMATYAATCPHSFANKKLQTLMNKFLRCISINSTNPIHFNAIISDSSRMGLPFLALTTFSFMHSNAIPLDTYAFCSTLNASSTLADVHFPKQIHAHLAKSGWSSSVFVASALIDLYSKLSTLKDAVLVFDETPHKNTVCANALLSGYVHAGFWVEQLELVRKMPVLKLKYDHFTLSAALRACTGLSAIELGRQLHSYLLRTIWDIESDVFLQSALIEMYGKCGMVKKAWQVFGLAGTEVKKERSRDVVLWTSMLGVYGRNGHYKEVIALYNEMLVEGIRPDGIAFLTVISACGRTGQVQEGVKYFESMANEFKLDPGPEHYSCLVDLLCRAGELHKAWEILNERVGKCSISMWGALLSACVDCGNIELGELAAERALHLDPQNVGICVMLSNLYAKFGMWDRIRELRALINASRLRKDVGCSWVQVTS
ncbi:pentatricopeptide repeat-containing protein At3g12770 isoform X2 [Arachis duranensis]|uniref:pentatricopeptide repeat-containing protein At3g12770 n=1 Tax=Arachis duranensis TaxID=130453 RepID=A0A6P5MGF0_ARADU|nr:pentatricopeptide repeat-containing protein At3g12770 isoform X1 [Arachis duranensis]XP_052108823.1 pentatricopeptide repeat-containing protein At3g12770 isoform X1 [Arachis duranensis]XP_052108824.1 pentatricopeptide repeat-containing protein At3g12770 isoform X1 [Arachis duranensis]XP_052108825.1 pentatricopeptide repeat-containing protein At3g12770 isoform X2 [Arachis duranensis]